MDVTRDNFEESFPLIAEAIRDATFISIDGEFSGINNGTYNTAAFDCVEERYLKLSCNTMDFLLLQFGLSAFIWNEDANQYEAKVFNFYIFPLQSSTIGAPDRIFSCQSSSVDFLLQHGFDFNRAFRQGVSYLRQSEETTLKKFLLDKQVQRDAFRTPAKDQKSSRISSVGSSPLFASPSMNMDEKTKEFVEKICVLTQDFLNTEEMTELALEPCNSYLRKVLYETIPNRFPNQIMLESKVDATTRLRHLVLLRGASDEIRKEREAQKKLQEEKNFQKAIGFSKVIKLITESQKLVVGHNMLLDVMFTIKQFVAILPNTLDEFKTLTQCVFPQVLDTKLMANLQPFKELITSTSLSDLYTQLRSSPFSPPKVSAPGKYDVTKDNVNFHEAAYDSYITGCCFATMLTFLSTMRGGSKRPSLSLVEPYLNKVFLMKMAELPYLNLAGADLSPNRDHVFFVTFPQSWKATDLRQLFSPFGQVWLAWVNDTSSFVSLNDKTQAENVRQSLIQPKGAEPVQFKVTSYDEYKEAGAAKSRSWSRSQASKTSPAQTANTPPARDGSGANHKRPSENSPVSSSTEPAQKKRRPSRDKVEARPQDLFEVPTNW